MPPVATSTARFRVSIMISKIRYYANRCSQPLPYVSWHEFSNEYPDHFNKADAMMIADFYNDQLPTIDRIRVYEEEDAT